VIEGSVSDDAKPFVEIVILGHGGVSTTVAAIVDTGFDAFLTLPPTTIAALRLVHKTDTTIILADETAVRVDLYEGHVAWHGQLIAIEVHEADGLPLIGMSLLGGSRLTIDAVPGGRVEIVPLPDA
jgi:clan AA aspartic protease